MGGLLSGQRSQTCLAALVWETTRASSRLTSPTAPRGVCFAVTNPERPPPGAGRKLVGGSAADSALDGMRATGHQRLTPVARELLNRTFMKPILHLFQVSALLALAL